MAYAQVSPSIYIPFVDDLINDKRLTLAAIRVGTKIAKGFMLKAGYCAFTLDQLANYLELSRSAVIGAIKQLERCEYVRVDRKTRCRNRYIPNFLIYDRQKILSTKNQESSADDSSTVHCGAPPIEEGSAASFQSAASSSKPTSRQREPNASPEERCDFASGHRVESITDFEKLVLDPRGPYKEKQKGFDPSRFKASVRKFMNVLRQDDWRWQGLAYSEKRLFGWLRREKYRTEQQFTARNSEDFVKRFTENEYDDFV